MAYIAFVPLFLKSYKASYKNTILLYFSSGVIIASGWWYSVVSYSILTFIQILLIMCLSFVCWGVISRRLYDYTYGSFWGIFVPILVWIGIERIHTSELIGVPGNIGISQFSQPLLIQSASLFGVYAVSFLVLLVNYLITYLILKFDQVRNSLANKLALSTVLIIVFGNIIYGYSVLENKTKLDNKIKVAIVQPVISSDVYRNSWRNPDNRKFMKKTFDELTSKAVDTGVDMIFWPEGGNGYLNMRIPELRQNLYSIAIDNNIDLIISSDDVDIDGNKYNSIFSISKKGKLIGRYDKVMLIPGAESSYTAGKSFHPIKTSHGLLGPAICYESNFPSVLRNVSALGAEFLFASTSDAAFKKTSLALSHTNLSIFRAIENRKWTVHASNAGPSMVVSPKGLVKVRATLYKREIITAEISKNTYVSFYNSIGYLLPILLAFFVCLSMVMLVFQMYKYYNYSTLIKFISVYGSYLMLISRINKILLLSCIHISIFTLLLLSSVYWVNYVSNDKTPFVTSLMDFVIPVKPEEDKISDIFLQAQKNTCGPAVLAYLFSYYGKDVLEGDLIQHMQVTEKGTSMFELKKIANNMGFNATGFKGNYPWLQKQSLPVIAYINNGHYVVINKMVDGFIYMFDPVEGHVRVHRSVFEHAWNGYILLVRMKPIPSV